MPYYLEHVASHPAAHGIITVDGRIVEETDQASCVHCQFNWVVKPGSGTKRGWCWRCGGPTCGKQKCETRCDPWERWVERVEARSRLQEAVARNFNG